MSRKTSDCERADVTSLYFFDLFSLFMADGGGDHVLRSGKNGFPVFSLLVQHATHEEHAALHDAS